MKFISIPFADAFGKCRWAQNPAFDDYVAVIPTSGPLNAPLVRTVRINNLRHVIDCALPDLKRLVRKAKTRKDAAAAGRLVLSVLRFRNKPVLPMLVRCRYRTRLRSCRVAFDHSRTVTHVGYGPPRVRWIDLQALTAHGLDEAIACGANPFGTED